MSHSRSQYRVAAIGAGAGPAIAHQLAQRNIDFTPRRRSIAARERSSPLEVVA